jgi:hypothetical protein
MKKLKLVGFAALALLAFAAFSASSALAETGSPQLLATNVLTLAGTFTAAAGGDIKLVSLSLKNDMLATSAEIKLKNCKHEGTEKDTTLCEDVPFAIKGYKSVGTNLACTNGAAEEVKGLLDLHFASEESEKTLKPLLLAKVLGGANGTSLTEPLEFKCGGVITVQEKGVLACLVSPGLTSVAAGGEITILCKVSAASDPELGKCEDLCEDFGKTTGFEASFNGGKTFEDVNELVHLKGTLNQEIFIDD